MAVEDLSNPPMYLSYTAKVSWPPVERVRTSKILAQVTTSAIVGTAGAIRENASKPTVLSFSTCYEYNIA
jgi:hypothetical protein